MTQPANAILRLREITERKGQKITARDIATAHMAIAAIERLQELADRHMSSHTHTLHTSVERGIQLDAVREMLAEIREILK